MTERWKPENGEWYWFVGAVLGDNYYAHLSELLKKLDKDIQELGEIDVCDEYADGYCTAINHARDIVDDYICMIKESKKKGFEKLLPKEVGEEYEFKSDGAELHIWRVG